MLVLLLKKKRKRIIKTIRKRESSLHKVSFDGDKLRKLIHPRRRVGRPRDKWLIEAMEEAFYIITGGNDQLDFKFHNQLS